MLNETFFCDFKHCAFRFFELERGVFIFSNEAIIKATALRRHHLYVTIYMTWMKLIIIEAIPYFTILTLNIAIIRQILSSSSFRRRFTRKQTTKEVRMRSFRALERHTLFNSEVDPKRGRSATPECQPECK